MEHNIIVYYINMIRTFVNVGPYDTIYDGKKKKRRLLGFYKRAKYAGFSLLLSLSFFLSRVNLGHYGWWRQLFYDSLEKTFR